MTFPNRLNYRVRASVSRSATSTSTAEPLNNTDDYRAATREYWEDSGSVFFVATMGSFKKEHPFEKRQAESQRIRFKYSDRIPVICEKADRSDIPDIDKKKYLVPADLTVGQFVYVIRKLSALMSNIYKEQKDSDGFLYVTYSGENTFGE
ncbi:hypothetical protein PR002_g25317 [Phytophthora rubi]|uniref:Autophagy-related protein n=1 Tax=Phytophthora rubi TaxID=129364 RepID=A0A6A3I0I5_9STRA|nr:hypothetical protein PR002_g25317 [Phytophthora rubi]